MANEKTSDTHTDPGLSKLNLDFISEESSLATDSPVFLFMDDVQRKVTKCYSTSRKPVTVVVHEYTEVSTTGRKEISSLPFKLCRSLYGLSVGTFTCPNLITRNSSTVNEFMSKRSDLEAVLSEDKNTCHCERKEQCKVLLIQHVINMLLGVLLLGGLYFYGPAVLSELRMYMDLVVKSMILLINWLMGFPAGLKLNYNLTVFLGRFFMYHIWLWAEYLRHAGHYFYQIFLTLAVIGLFGGASLQLALIQDMFKIFFLHIDCFYIYSSRLYSLTRHSLRSLWRLFRGLKWNLLRERVDHATYDSTQLFIGTLLFSIFLFISPTVILYYLVFASIRSLTVAFDLCLSKVRYLFAHSYVLLWEPVLAALCNAFSRVEYGLSVEPFSGDNITVLTVRHRGKPPCSCSSGK